MKSIRPFVMLASMLILSACQPATPAPVTESTPPTIASQAPISTVEPAASETPLTEIEDARPLLKTSLGDFEIASARFVDEVNGVTPGEGEKILLIGLSRPGGERLDPVTFPLEDFNKMSHDTSQGEIHILGDDGSETISTMGGWVEKEFVMGFRVPADLKTYMLIWPGNNPITILPEG